MHRRAAVVLAVASAAAAFAALPRSADAKAKVKPSPSWVTDAVTPLGLQGTASSGGNIVIIFTAHDVFGRPIDVEVQYGTDRNADGQITDDEYRPATEDRFDVRNSRANKSPQLFHTGATDGSANAYVWKSLADVWTTQIAMAEFAHTPQGRYVPDPDNPGSFKFATGPNGSEALGGVKVRVRAMFQRRKHGPRLRSDWIYTDAFAVNNASTPSMTIDAAASGTPILVNWTVSDADSEDLNGNGQLDIAGGEDINGNGVLDCEKAGVAFDWHRLAAGENPAAMTDAQLETLRWQPCTRLAGVGDTDSLGARIGVPLPATGDLAGVCTGAPGVGRHWVFAWDVLTDVGGTPDRFIVRGTPFCQHRSRGKTVYSRIVVHE